MPATLTDSHCHLASHKFSTEELDAVITRAHEHGVTRMVTLATCLDDCPTNLKIADSHPEVFACVGIHPCDVHETPDDYLNSLEAFALHPRCVAIGETGLDYYHPAPDGWTDDAYRSRQRDFLDQHFNLAASLGKNIVIHTRDQSGDASLQDALTLYRKHAHQVRAVFHCFPFDMEAAQPILDLGGLVSFTGIATFKNAPVVIDTASRCPAGSFMVETDAPYLAPVPHRGQRNEPAFTHYTAKSIAHARGESLDDLAQHTEMTAETFYQFPTAS
ncbi:MAG: TatD family hydrolase [Verrucomicrobiae bacterium]|nr:TatD family hydrolase [Verrucomicrobiae bacterium]NNJ42060.1 TatD family hydrolase [Akkermansiaceae bacterium]